jgi:hypothetical protein|tara:strand:- start:4517 stop:4768 length:252 start_codon:yes stop_codon:yes gene_type:complete
MNVVLNTDETNVVLALVTSQILDHLDLSTDGKELIRGWRRDHNIGSSSLNDFAVELNEAVGNFIDDNTRRMIRQRGKIKTLER